jgi:aromatic-L-amino-acid decarboxylase
MKESATALSENPHPLELSGDQLRKMVGGGPRQAHPLARIPPGSAHGPPRREPEAREGPERGPPRGGDRLSGPAQAPLRAGCLATSLNTAGPGYLGYIPGGGLPHAAVADLFADLTNRYTGLWMPAPGMVQLEINVVRWFCDLVGFGTGSGGLLTTGGSMANLGAVVAARKKLLGDNFLDGVIYLSEQVHHSLAKSAYVAGFSERNLRVVPVDERFRIDPMALSEAIAADRAAGLRPFLVVGNAGSTAVGAVDDLEALGALCAAEGLWFHVDGAYGGFFLLTERGREALRGIALADSVALDPHKGLFLPYGTGGLVVRRLSDLRAAHTVASAYLPAPQDDDEAWDFADLGPELSRDWRGLRVWLPLKMHGARIFRETLDEKLDLARVAAERLSQIPGLARITDPTLSLFCFRFQAEGWTEAELDRWNRRILSAVNQRQRVFLTGATVRMPQSDESRFVIRVCVLSFRTHQGQIDALIEDLEGALAENPTPPTTPPA